MPSPSEIRHKKWRQAKRLLAKLPKHWIKRIFLYLSVVDVWGDYTPTLKSHINSYIICCTQLDEMYIQINKLIILLSLQHERVLRHQKHLKRARKMSVRNKLFLTNLNKLRKHFSAYYFYTESNKLVDIIRDCVQKMSQLYLWSCKRMVYLRVKQSAL